MVYFKKATMDDFEFFYDLKCEENNIFWTGHGEKPQKENLKKFYEHSVNTGGDSYI